MLKRLLTAGIGVILFFCVLPAPVKVFNIAVLIITVGAVYEINNAVTKRLSLKITGMLSAALVFVGMITGYLIPAIMITAALYIILSVVLFGREKVWDIYMLGFAGIMFSAFLSTLALLKSEYSAYVVILPFLFAWITDSGAYFTGVSIGKHKLAPTLSPKKTIEGAVGGIVFCIIISVVYMIIAKHGFDFILFEENAYINIVVLSASASVVSQLGDLASSAIKRDYNIKDYGNILPGHGGILDRFDSVVFTAPFVYYLLSIIK